MFVDPLFNDYKPLRDGAGARGGAVAGAREPDSDRHVVEFDASRQTTRISANVAGFAGTTRVALNDNLLDKTSLPEIKAVLGHEMGHYVLNHGLRLTVYLSLVIAFGFWFVHRVLDGALARWGARLDLRGRADPAALPLAVAILSLFFFLATPLLNSIVRQAETEADAFGLNAAREPQRLRDGRDAAVDVSQDPAGRARGNPLLRPSERLRTRARLDALADGKPGQPHRQRAAARAGTAMTPRAAVAHDGARMMRPFGGRPVRDWSR